jgi:hypothetical protein
MNAEYVFANVYPRAKGGQRAATRLDGRILGLIVGLLLLVTLAALLYLSQASVAARIRYQLQSCSSEQVRLREEMAVLRCQIAIADSAPAIETRAQQIGLVPALASATYVYCEVPAAGNSTPLVARAMSLGKLQVARGQPNLIERLSAFFAPKPRQQAMAAQPKP